MVLEQQERREYAGEDTSHGLLVSTNGPARGHPDESRWAIKNPR